MLKRLVLLLGSVVMALVLLEVALQVGHLFVKDWSVLRRQSEGSALRVLCLGDSNTYGLNVPRDKTYPARLETLWNEKADVRPIVVLNMGYPGTNSSQVLRDFDRQLDLFEPEVVLLEVGANDFWTQPVATDVEEPWSLLKWLQHTSRVYKLLYMATRNANDTAVVIDTDEHSTMDHAKAELRYGGEVFEAGHDLAPTGRPSLPENLRRNLTAIIEKARARNVRLFLLDYASNMGLYSLTSRILGEVGAETRTSVFRLRPIFLSVCPKEPCPEWIFPQGHPAHDHPTEKGYDLVASTVAQELRRMLADGKLDPPASPRS